MSMTDKMWEEYSSQLADRLVALAETQERTLEDIREMGDEIKRIEGVRLEWIRRARTIGVPAQQVADAAGISRQQVYRITGRVE
jgi:hypothetical protein